MNQGIDFGGLVAKPAKEGDKEKPKTLRIRLTDILGDSVTLENPEEYSTEKPWEVTPEDYASIIEIAEKISENRGRIISKSIMVEDYIDDSLEEFLFGSKITEISKLSRIFILAGKFFTFENKRIVLHRFMKNHSLFKGNDHKREFTLIKKVIDIRNKSAHGKIIFRGKRAFLEYTNDSGMITEDELSDDYFKEKFETLRDTLLVSSELHNHINSVLEKVNI
jgi:hypothetical protein